MASHVKNLAAEMAAAARRADFGAVSNILSVLYAELQKLEPEDFVPAGQVQFLLIRERVRGLVATKTTWFNPNDQGLAVSAAEDVEAVLESYAGKGTGGKVRSFTFVRDPDLRRIAERDYRELKLKVYPSGAWKSVVILAGSILEALLYDRLSFDPTIRSKAMAACNAPTDKGKTKDIENGRWYLADLIAVAVELKIVSAERERTIDHVLRNFRNFVHPMKERADAHACGESEAMMAFGALNGICDTLEKAESGVEA